MEEENAIELLQRYRRDRQTLLDFVLSGSLIKKVVMPPGAVTLDDVDLDQVSVDYVLNCAKKGAMLELSEAIRDYHDLTGFPQMNNSGCGDEFFLVTDLDSSGSPPKRAPPPAPAFTPPPVYTPPAVIAPPPMATPSLIERNVSRSESFESSQARELTVDDIDDFEDDEDVEVNSVRMSRRNPNDPADLALKLPSFSSGITDDDLRETAYEVLLACAGASGGLIVPSAEKKKDKKSKLMRKLGRSSKSGIVVEPHRAPGLVGLLETMRVQMEISESMDVRTRKGLLNALSGKVGKRMDTLLVPLELLSCISKTEFSDRKAFLRWQKRQLNILEEGLINHPVVGFGESGRKASELRILLSKIEESESLPPSTGELQRIECLRLLREISISLAERPARGDLTGEVCHWADGYPLNVRLYEKLLASVFDMLDEGKLTEEVEEILELLKSTWRVLGITETIHYTCFTWVLFRQFVITSEQGMLQHAIEQLKKVPLKEQRGPQERLHLKSLHSELEEEGSSREFSFLNSFIVPIQGWADRMLGDYHLHFSEDPRKMGNIVTVAMLARRLLLEESETAESMSRTDKEQIEFYILSSLKSAFSRVLHSVEKSETNHEHSLALLAEETKKLLKRDSSLFIPILSQRDTQATIVSASLLHKLYGYKLKPFLDGIEHLTEDVVSVFPAANSLEEYILTLITSACEEMGAEIHIRKLSLYQIESISGTLVLRWVNSQLGRILGWVERAIQQETVDQFFALQVPMRLTELNCLLRGIDNAFQVYANHVIENLASKEDLIPPPPILTRYKKEAGIKAFVKKEKFDTKMSDERRSTEINVLTTPTLCVQLNTLYYAISQLNKLEDSIWDRWTSKKNQKSMEEESKSGTKKKESFDGSRKDINIATDRICEFTGTKIVFWDLREPFIDGLYKPSVFHSRLEALIEPLDTELSKLCDIIVEPLRDRIVTSLLQASLDGLLRVILDGGPSRVFSTSDSKLLEEDLEVLKEFFISGGDGLPRGVVENLVAHVRDVIKLHGYETRELIEDLRSVSGGNIQSGRYKAGADSKTLLRILCHRSDSEASQFLKKQYKIPSSSV
ncbi:protein unc-13 homolog isoform X2 [Cucumis melo]|uniref:Protein unc-13 homolog isoform X2 n=1 Tax=Cucumis melo TaxID=3656 RepID=A0ABM3LA57_CUCME|nr:protein unc-13 homolog isoform X2 [Cucumis melo]